MNFLPVLLTSVVIVLDPGHGGENMGAVYGDNVEKYCTMITAEAMKEELEKYEDVEVYLTHEDPEENMGLPERAQFAEDVDADFVISIHYNAKDDHDMYGCEVWIPMKGEPNSEAYRLSRFVLDEWTSLPGMFNRGIKTRKGSTGEYYGILRESVAREIPAVILEHAHFDNERDLSFVDSEEDFRNFGVLDATAVAKYFGLKSEELGVDYSLETLDLYEVDLQTNYAVEDVTVPEVCEIELVNVDYDNNQVTLNIKAEDSESCIYYYCISTDGGRSYGPLYPWPEHDVYTGESVSEITVTQDVLLYLNREIKVKVYNQYDRKALSNSFTLKGKLPKLADLTTVTDEAKLDEEKALRLTLVSEIAKSVKYESEDVIYSLFTCSELDDGVKERITGVSYPVDDSNIKISYDDLRYLTLVYKDFSGKNCLGEMICNKKIADEVLEIFRELYDAGYPLESVKLVEEFGGDDELSMENNNTSCFNYRVIEGSNTISNHGLGLAIDINPLYNPYVKTNKNGTKEVSPKAGEIYADRNAANPYLIDKNDTAYKIFKKHGFTWGGSWKSVKDYQHFEK